MSKSDRATILYVVGRTGVPIDHALPKIAVYGQVTALVLAEQAPAVLSLMQEYCYSIYHLPYDIAAHDLPEKIAALARSIQAQAIVNFDEISVTPVARACSLLGLRGAGQNAEVSRDKFLMRQAFANGGVKNPKFALVIDEKSLPQKSANVTK